MNICARVYLKKINLSRGAAEAADCEIILTELCQTEEKSVRSYQALQEPRRSGDDEEKLLHQLCDEGYLGAL